MAGSKRVQGFLPSRDGFRFTNSFPSQPDIIINLPIVGEVAIGDAQNGLCGGMVFAVKDFHEARLPTRKDVVPPTFGTPLFSYIVARLFDSFNIPGGVLKYMDWMNTPDHDTGVLIAVRRGLGWRTVQEEWPQIKDDIDSDHLSPLALVTIASINPGDLGRNHQVLAYGYDLDDAGSLTIHAYDPNTRAAAGDAIALSLNIGNPAHTTPITHTVNIGFPVRGFFRVEYSPRDPSLLLAHGLPRYRHLASVLAALDMSAGAAD